MVNFERDYFKNMSISKKRDYIDKLIQRGIRLTKEELDVATKEQKRVYINLLIAQTKTLEYHEIEVATDKQMTDYITQKRWVSLAEYPNLPDKFKKIYIDVALGKRAALNPHELSNTPEHLKKYFANQWFERGFQVTPSIFYYLSKEHQKNMIDSTLSMGNKLILDFIPYMKPGVEAYYKKAVKEHPHLWENLVLKKIRTTLFEAMNTNNNLKKITKTLKDNEVFKIIDSSKAPGTDPMAGACWIIADALNIAFGWPVYALYNKKLKHLDHFVVKVGDKYLDAMGLQTEQEVFEENVLNWHLSSRTDIATRDMRLVKYNPILDSLNKDIIRDLDASKKIAKYLEVQTN